MAKIPVAQEQAAIYVQKDGYTLTLPLGEMYFRPQSGKFLSPQAFRRYEKR